MNFQSLQPSGSWSHVRFIEERGDLCACEVVATGPGELDDKGDKFIANDAIPGSLVLVDFDRDWAIRSLGENYHLVEDSCVLARVDRSEGGAE